MSVLVTGGAGYIGSHTCVELLSAGYDVVVIDNLENSSREALLRVEKITGKAVKFYEADVRDTSALENIFKEQKINAVIHFAGLKAVGESMEKPLLYYETNLGITIFLLKMMEKYGVKKIIFSSTATVYGTDNKSPLDENCSKNPVSPYSKSKLIIEQILKSLFDKGEGWSIAVLRYFNPVGAHESGLLGEVPKGIPNNLMPYISQVAVGVRDKLKIFGNDYPTPDGTGIRDYIHVCDLAQGHLNALKFIENRTVFEEINIGTGVGVSVLEMVKTFEKANGVKIPYEFAPRRKGDIAEYFADVKKAEKVLGFKAEKNILDMCKDAYNFQAKNNNGY